MQRGRRSVQGRKHLHFVTACSVHNNNNMHGLRQPCRKEHDSHLNFAVMIYYAAGRVVSFREGKYCSQCNWRGAKVEGHVKQCAQILGKTVWPQCERPILETSFLFIFADTLGDIAKNDRS